MGMQLFYCDSPPSLQSGMITLHDDRINHQCLHVLRMRPGKPAVLQRGTTRWYCLFDHYIPSQSASHKGTPPTTIRSIKTQDTHHTPPNPHALCLAMLNKWDKVELVAQKIAECGLGTLYLFPAHRSCISQPNHKKMERLTLIAREASEQSRNWYLPSIIWVDHPPQGYHMIKADFGGQNARDWIQQQKTIHGPICLCIGPEGGWDERDPIHTFYPLSLGSSVLRAETAAIIGGWILCNMDHPQETRARADQI
ncbi:MAG: RsmE family RNA methyltransferase [Candidatus Absconditabacterales bacterium]|nr:RsmE family RNA methyltransferase [Candidatus Absconditabacterales bacterium]